MRRKKYRKSAFSLIEMSIVLVIIAIIVSGMLTISTVAVNNAKITATKERMNEIYKALGRFLLQNHRLPCPASLVANKNTAGYGIEVGTAGACAGTGVYISPLSSKVFYGALPTALLGLPSEYGEDGFGSKFAYIVYQDLTVSGYPVANTTSFSYSTLDAIAMPGTIAMPSAAANNTKAFILLSFGPNKFGAFNADSSSQNTTSGASTYEMENILTSISNGPSGGSAEYGSSSYNTSIVTIVSSDESSTVFDDIVLSKTRNDMVTDFNAMFMIPCPSPGTGFTDTYYGTIQYRNTTCSAPDDNIIPSAECAAFGTSVTKQTCP